MTASNDFQPLATGGSANVMSQSAYLALASTLIANGFASGEVLSTQINKVLRQATFPGAALAQLMADTLNTSILDDGNLSEFEGNLKKTIQALCGSYSSEQTFTSAGALPATIQGAAVVLNIGAGGTFTLPAASAFANGGAVIFTGAAAGQVLQRAGSDQIVVNGTTGLTSMTLGSGDSALLVSNGAGNWNLYGGSMQAAYAASYTSWLSGYLTTNIQSLVAGCIAAVATAAGFAWSFGTNGYFKCPSWLAGFMVVWGQVFTSSGSATPTFAGTFPTGPFGGLSCIFGAVGNASTTTQIGTPSTTSTTIYANTTAGGPAAGTTLCYWIFGH